MITPFDLSTRPRMALLPDIPDASGLRFVGIGGCGGSGKTALAALIPGASTVHLDDFATPDRPGWDSDRFMSDVASPLLGGTDARYQRFDWDRNQLAEWHTVPAASLVIVEGVTALTVDIPYVLTIWVDTPRSIRLQRGVARDGEAKRVQWTDVWMPEEDEYIALHHPDLRADFVVDGTAFLHRAINTDRLELTPISITDVDALVELDSDPKVMQFLTNGKPGTNEEVRLTIQSSLNDRWCARLNNEFIGWFALERTKDDEYELGYRLKQAYWGNGLATEGCRALLAYAFDELNARRVWAQTMAVNERSRAVMERLGMQYLRTFHEHFEDPIPGTEHGEVEYEIICDRH